MFKEKLERSGLTFEDFKMKYDEKVLNNLKDKFYKKHFEVLLKLDEGLSLLSKIKDKTKIEIIRNYLVNIKRENVFQSYIYKEIGMDYSKLKEDKIEQNANMNLIEVEKAFGAARRLLDNLEIYFERFLKNYKQCKELYESE